MGKTSRLFTLASLVTVLAAGGAEAQPRQAPTDPRFNRDYLCKVIPNNIAGSRKEEKKELPKSFQTATAPGKQKRNEYKDGVLSIFYGTSSWKLHRNDRQDLLNYLRIVPSGSSFIIEGHADFRCPEGWNLVLSNNRANGVAELIPRLSSAAGILTTAYGESKAKQNVSKPETAADRVVKIIPNVGVIQRGLDLLVADSYLIDQSASMNDPIDGRYNRGSSKWSEVLKYKFPKNSEVYTFTSSSRQCDTKLSQAFPMGQTPLYSALLTLVERAEQGKRFTVLTDGENNMPGSKEAIIELARKKKISISFLGLGLKPGYQAELRAIADATGGSIYMHQKSF